MKNRFYIQLILEPTKILYYVNKGHYTLDKERAFVFSSREVCLDIQAEEKKAYDVDVQIVSIGE